MLENINIEQILQDYILPWSINIVSAILVFYIGRFIVSLIVDVCRKLLERANFDEMLVGFLCSILRWTLLLFVIIAALSQLQVNTTSMVALLGAAGLAIGLSLQSSLSNFASGVLLVVFRPFTKGNFVEVAGTTGVVQQIGIFTTTLLTPDNKEIIVPNGAIYGSSITNYSARDTRRVDMKFGVSYGDDIKLVKQILTDIVNEDPRILDEPAPVIALGELGESSVNFLVRPWAKTEDYWAVLWDTNEEVKRRFDAQGVSIPFPQMDVHMDSPAKTAD